MSMAAVAIVEPPSNLRAEFVERVLGYWHKGRANILAMGRTLIEAKAKLERGQFLSMLADDFPFTPRQAQNFMELARDGRLTDTKHVSHLPVSQRALTAISELGDAEFEAGLAHGVIRPDVTEREVRDFQRQITRPETVETGAAWNAIVETRKQHRPESSKCGAPVAPQGRWATQWPELCHLLIERRKALKIAQEALDDKILCGQGQVSKWEIPHQDDGRIPRADNLMDWIQALGLRIELVAVP